MAAAGDIIENPITGQRLVFLANGGDGADDVFRAEGVFPPGGFAGVEHIHPFQDEHFDVLAGTAAFTVDDEERTLGAGEAVDVSSGARHTFWNAGDDEMRVLFEFRPALEGTARFYEIYFGFAQEARVKRNAMPGLLDIATVWPETAEHAVLAKPPAWVQHALFRSLRPLARLARRTPPRCARRNLSAE